VIAKIEKAEAIAALDEILAFFAERLRA